MVYINTEEHGVINYQVKPESTGRIRLTKDNIKIAEGLTEGYSIIGIFKFGDYLYFMSQSETEKKMSIARTHH